LWASFGKTRNHPVAGGVPAKSASGDKNLLPEFKRTKGSGQQGKE